MDKIKKGEEYIHKFSFNQAQVVDFAEITGDKNPIHLDENFASKSILKKRIIHGFLGGSVFSKILASFFPGEGTIYLEQSMKFIKPMMVEEKYSAICRVEEILPKNRARLVTQVFDANGSVCIEGYAVVMNIDKIPNL